MLSNVERLDDSLLRQLFATPPDEFVAARNTIVKQLKAEGDREYAAEVAGLRRPSWIDWALDVAAAEHTDVTAAFADAAADLREAQRAAGEGRPGVNLRGSINELRDRSAALVRVANDVLRGHGRPAALPDLTERLTAVAASESASERLRAGLLGPVDDEDDGGGDGFGTLDDASEPHRPSRKATAREHAKPKQKPEREQDADREDRRRLERDVKELERTLSSTRRRMARADTAVRHATVAMEAAAGKVAEATAALEQAEQRLAEMTTARDELSKAADEISGELDDARRSLDRLGG